MRAIDWNSKAAAMAWHAGNHMMSAHRGVMGWHQVGILTVFGNDCYDDDHTKQEVEVVLEKCEEAGVQVLGFGVDPEDGYSWAMLVRETPEFGLAQLHDAVHSAARDSGFGATAYHAQSALEVIAEHGIMPDYSEN